MKSEIPEGYCACGKKTNLIEQTRKKRGLIKGQYRKYTAGHQNRLKAVGSVLAYAREKGYKSEKELLEAMVKKHKTYARIAKEIGLTPAWVGALIRKYKVKTKNQRLTNNEKRERWNAENGTDYKTTREWLAALYEEFGSAIAANKSGAYKSYVQQCAKEQRAIDGVKSSRKQEDSRPSNLVSPWTDRNIAPCKVCKFSRRDKNEPGCSACSLPGEYVQLIEEGGYPGVKVPGQAPVYYNAKGRAHVWHEWGQR